MNCKLPLTRIVSGLKELTPHTWMQPVKLSVYSSFFLYFEFISPFHIQSMYKQLVEVRAAGELISYEKQKAELREIHEECPSWGPATCGCVKMCKHKLRTVLVICHCKNRNHYDYDTSTSPVYANFVDEIKVS